jgi:hypothetical protein
LNPDVPKPRVIHTCKSLIIAEKPKDEKELEDRKANEKAGKIQNMD